MSWSHSSRLCLAALVLLGLVATAGVASAVTVTESSVPEEAEDGEQVTLQFEIQDLYAEESSWSFDGRTSLENATWTVEQYQGDSQVGSNTFQASSPPNEEIQIDESASDAPDRLVVEISGTVPSVESFSYADPATFRGAELARVGADGATVIEEWQIHHYTTGDPGSDAARTALDDANATIQSAAANGTDVSQAESTFQSAVSAYDAGNFQEAVSLAADASSQASAGGSDSDGGATDGGTSDGTDSNDDGGSSDGDGTSDGTGTTDGSGSADDGATDGTSDQSGGESTGSDGAASDRNGSDVDDPDANGSDANASDDSDDGGLLWPILYVVMGILVLGAVGGGVYWYQQQQQGPSRDPLG